MVRLFNHWFASSTLIQVALDAVLLFLLFMVTGVWLAQGTLAVNFFASALLFAVAMVILNSLVGMYRRDPYRTAGQAAARVAVSILFTMPVAYAMFNLQPWAEVHPDVLKIVAAAAVTVLVAARALASHRSTPAMFARRVLVFGTGP